MESSDPEESVQMINLSQTRNLSHPGNESVDTTSSSNVLVPSAPNLSKFSNVSSIQPAHVYPVLRPVLPPPPQPMPKPTVQTITPPPEYQPIASTARVLPYPVYLSDLKK